MNAEEMWKCYPHSSCCLAPC